MHAQEMKCFAIGIGVNRCRRTCGSRRWALILDVFKTFMTLTTSHCRWDGCKSHSRSACKFEGAFRRKIHHFTGDEASSVGGAHNEAEEATVCDRTLGLSVK